MHTTSSKNASQVPQNLTLEGPRLILKPIHINDAYQLRELLTDPISMENLKSIRKSLKEWSLENAQQQIENHSALQRNNMKLNFHVFAKPTLKGDESDTGKEEPTSFIGTAGLPKLELFNHSATVGIIIHHKHVKSNFGTECLYLILKYAFENLNLHRVAFETTQGNSSMRGWLEKVALVSLESVLKQAIFEGERYTDLCVYPIFPGQWFEVTKPALEKRLGL